MRKRQELKHLLSVLTFGWILLLIEVFLLIWFPDMDSTIGKFIFFIGLIIVLLTAVVANFVLSDKDYWNSLENLDIEYEKWKRNSREATIYKEIYMNEVLNKFALSSEEIKEKIEQNGK